MKKTKSKRKKSTFIKGVRPKTEGVFTTVITVALIFFSTFLIYTKSIDSLEAEIKLGLKSNVSAAATTINGDLHKLFN